MRKIVYEIDGDDFSSLDEFYEEVSKKIIPGADWGKNLDAFDDILEGGFGTPDEGFVIHWKNSARSKQKLGYGETVKYLETILNTCHPLNVEHVKEKLELAKRNVGETVFDILIEIIEKHCKGGEEEDDGVELVLR